MYHINSGIWSSVFAVPTEIVDKHIRLCGALSLKVLMLMLRHGSPLTPEDLAHMLNQSPADIKDAVNYWIDLGIIGSGLPQPAETALLSYQEQLPHDSSPIPPVDLPELPLATQLEDATKKERRIVRVGRSRPRLSTREITTMAKHDGNVGALLKEAQLAFGRTLKPIETETLSTLYSYDNIPVDIILMILQYCISIEKTSMGYLEKLALDWMERGVDTHEAAELEILRMTEQTELERSFRSAFGIYGRKPTDKELAFYRHWTTEFNFSNSIIMLAYERSIEAKGKLNTPYMNGILENWNKLGISSPDQALRNIRENSAKYVSKKANQSEPKASYNLEKFEEVIKPGKIWD